VRDYPPHADKEGVLANQRLEMKLASSATVNIVASMRIAVLADIHGNLLALEAVIRDLHTNTPDLVVNLGDHLSGPLWAAATADLLISQTDWVHIRGNHDRQLVELQPDAMGQSDRAAAVQLSMSQKSWLASLPSTTVVADEVLLCHGTPELDHEYLAEDVSGGFARVASHSEIRNRLGPIAGLILCGHSHVARYVRIDDNTAVVNPGSVGIQAYYDSEHRFPHVIESGSPHARYLLLDGHGRDWQATFRLIDYAWDRAALLAERGLRPEWCHALRTGYVPR
jgi:predicted phosphodiesterase